MIFLDTSAIYALADKADPNHTAAYNKFEDVLKSGEIFLASQLYPVGERCPIAGKIGASSALLFLKDAKSFEVEWVDLDLHEEAEKELERIGKTGDQFSGLHELYRDETKRCEKGLGL